MPRCRVSDCTVKYASFNNSGETIGICCSKHKLVNMVNVIDKTCQFNGCKTRPSYNYSDKKNGNFCKEHKLVNMFYVLHKTCQSIDCKKQPSFNLPNEKIPIYCKEHKLEDMIDVKNKTCKSDGCKIIPCYNFTNEKIPIYCKEHKLEDMIDVKNKTCKSDGCKIRPNYNFSSEKIPIYCKEHKLEDMIDKLNKTCRFDDCKKIPNYNSRDQKKGIFCKEHSKPGMINVKNKSCKNSWCNIQIIKKYKDYCLRCFIHEFPDQKISRNYKIKETHVTDYLKETFPNKFTFDKTITGGCSKRRPDAYIDLLTHIIIVEIDENQHQNYDSTCEIARINELFTDLGDRPIVFIRFNPDEYDDKPSSFKYHKTSDVPMIRDTEEWKGRLESLKNCIHKHINIIPNNTIFEYLFYNKT